MFIYNSIQKGLFSSIYFYLIYFFTYFNLCVCLIICIKIWIIVGNKSVEAEVFIFYPYRGFLNIMQSTNCDQVITPNQFCFFLNYHLQKILMLLKKFVFKVRQFVILKADETLLRNHLKPAKDTAA